VPFKPRFNSDQKFSRPFVVVKKLCSAAVWQNFSKIRIIGKGFTMGYRDKNAGNWDNRTLVAFFAAAALCSGLSFASQADKKATDPAVIVNSGSTNLPGYSIAVDRSGEVKGAYSNGNELKQKHRVPASLVKQFYADLDAAQPLESQPHGVCAKSASFGSTLTIEFHNQKTPDLSCPGDNAKLQSLGRDAQEIINSF
jgi:hypothetical protein